MLHGDGQAIGQPENGFGALFWLSENAINSFSGCLLYYIGLLFEWRKFNKEYWCRAYGFATHHL